MTPPYLPAGPAHDADLAHPIHFFSTFFAVAFSNAFFMIFRSLLGPENHPKIDLFLKMPLPGAIFS